MADMEQAARVALTGLRPAFETTLGWQRWASLIAASAAGAGTMAVAILVTWTMSAAMTRHDANAEVMRWQAWWLATCGDQSPRRVVVAGKPVCQVPIERTAAR